jgi:methylated-DNA-[protein]-cysteine S-methyltransferase
MSAAGRRRLSAPAPPAVAVQRLKTPVGVLDVAASPRSLMYIGLAGAEGGARFDHWLRTRFVAGQTMPILTSALQQLREYFAGERRQFDIDLDPGGTAFQRRVWETLLTIPYGQTISYGELARRLGGAARAIGGAVGANPLPIIIPCHRVIGADGSLTGYGGGLRMKVWLLRHEGALLA